MADESQHPARQGDGGNEHKQEQEQYPRVPDADGTSAAADPLDEALDAIEGRADRDAVARPRQAVREMMAMFGQWGPAPNPLAEKITSDHISTMLEIDRERVQNQREDGREARRNHTIMFCGFCIFVLALLWLLLWAGNDDLTEKILIGLVTSLASGIGGYGYGRSKKD